MDTSGKEKARTLQRCEQGGREAATLEKPPRDKAQEGVITTPGPQEQGEDMVPPDPWRSCHLRIQPLPVQSKAGRKQVG